MIDLVLGQPLLHQLHYFLLRKKLVGSALHIFFGKGLGTLERLVKGQLPLQLVPPRGKALDHRNN